MNNDVEKLLRSFEGPDPSPDVSQRIFAAAREHAQANAKATRSRRILRAVIAAAACLVVGIAILLMMSAPETPTQPAHVAAGTVAGEQLPVIRNGDTVILRRDDKLFAGDRLIPEVRSDILLADGSTVRLDAGAQLLLDAPAEDVRARLNLTTGRIFARVTPAPGEFIINGTGEIRVLGTAFGIEEHTNLMEVSVLEGAVALMAGDGQIRLARGETGAVERGTAPRKIADDPNIRTRWARDAVHFTNKPLGEILDWLSLNTSYRFTLPQEVRAVRVSISIADEPIHEIIDTIGISCGLKLSVHGYDVRITE